MDDPKKNVTSLREKKWTKKWEDSGVYRYNPLIPRNKTYVIDTPPPTVSGSLHIGHVFSYTQTDIIARYKRMCGFNIYYPMGWDDNGLPTERRIQKLFNLFCDPKIPNEKYIDFENLKKVDKKTSISRKKFIELCEMQTKIDEQKYETLWRRLGLSVDWTLQYSTINRHSQLTSQLSFLDLALKKFAYNKFEPTYWDTDFQTAIAQAEMEDREQESYFHRIIFSIKETGDKFEIATTRPEMLPACIAIVAHPKDERYTQFIGLTAISPLFSVEIPFLPSTHAIPEKGTGALMICTFGDSEDFHFWRKSNLPLRQILNKQGRFMDIKFKQSTSPFKSSNMDRANEFYKILIGLNIPTARKEILNLLSIEKVISGEPEKVTQAVKFYEKGEKPLELIPIRQWYIRLLDQKENLLRQGRKVNWHPEFMRQRYDQWVEALNQDWSISRQRYFGVPIPVWYKLNEKGDPDYQNPIFPIKEQLPIDPQIDCPHGYSDELRNQPGGFIGDPDVMDTWATSSMTPQINSYWQSDEERHRKLFPADLRPQAHEIIRTWAFYTITKSWLHEQEIPWKDIAISGWVVDPNKNKMSKSKGNIIEPESIIEKYSADAIRYWASKAKLGSDTLFDENAIKIGKKLELKLLNAARFVQSFSSSSLRFQSLGFLMEPIDISWLMQLMETVKEATSEFENLNYSLALEIIEKSFWQFCNDYIEIVKVRAYQESRSGMSKSAISTLQFSINVFVRLFAPYMPYVTEEIWSSLRKSQSSIHQSAWPDINEFPKSQSSFLNIWSLCQRIVHEIRQQKAIKKMGVGHSLLQLEISSSSQIIDMISFFRNDLINVSRVSDSGLTLLVTPEVPESENKFWLRI